MIDPDVEKTLKTVADFFDRFKIGYTGHSGYRKTTDLYVLLAACRELLERNLIDAHRTVFLDLGCGDGRVNLFMSYLCRLSIGVELEDFIYEEYAVRRRELEDLIASEGLIPIPDNVSVILGNSLKEDTHNEILNKTGVTLRDVDIFYTYITLHDAFAELIAEKARPGAFYMVYGFNSVLPRYDGFTLLEPDLGNQGLIALYRKS